MESYMQWTIGMQLTDEEQSICHEFCLAAGRVMGLTNDYYSWKVEKRHGAGRQWNAIPVTMRQYGWSENDTVAFVQSFIIRHEQEVERIGEELQGLDNATPDMKAYVDAMMLMLGGNSFWSSCCPRYNTEGISGRTYKGYNTKSKNM